MSDSPHRSTVLVDADHPWLGLLSFREEHRRFFFGRDREIEDLHERVRRNRLTVLYGPSGLGKTSILQAGLCPLLREGGTIPVLIRLTYPGREPDAVQPPALLVQIAEKIAAALGEAGHSIPPLLLEPSAITSLWPLFHDTVGGLCGKNAPRIVVLFDQFEEIFTLGEDEARARDDAATLRDALADIVENRPSPAVQRQIDINPELAERFEFDAEPCRIAIVLREDYLARLERWRSAMPGLLRNRMEIRLLNGTCAFEAVTGPARLEDRDIVTDSVAADIVRAVAGAVPGTPLDEIDAVPPLLSLLCAKLNERRLENSAPQISADLLKISVHDILDDFYKGCFSGLPAAAVVRDTIESLLLSPSGFRETPSADSVITALRTHRVADPAAVLRHLENERLITSEERGGIRRVEITHDVLAPLAHASREARREQEEKDRLAQETRLAQQRQLAAEEQAKRQARQLRRTRRLAAFLCLLTVACLGAIAYAVIKDRESEKNLQTALKLKIEADAATKLAQEKAQESNASLKIAEEQIQKADLATRGAQASAAESLLAKKTANDERNRAEALLREHSQRDFAAAFKQATQKDLDLTDPEGMEDPHQDDLVPLLARALQAWPENEDASIFLWLHLRLGAATRTEMPMWTVHLPADVNGDSVTWIKDGKGVVAALADGRIAIITMPPAQGIHFLPSPDPKIADAKVVDPEARYEYSFYVLQQQGIYLAGREQGGWHRWDLASGERRDFPGSTILLSASPDGLRAVAQVSEGTAAIVDLDSGRTLGQPFPLKGASPFDWMSNRIAWKKDGSAFIYFDSARKLQMRNGRTGAALGKAVDVGKIGNYPGILLDPTDSFVLLANGDSGDDVTTEFWDIRSQPQLVRKFSGLRGAGWHPLTGRALYYSAFCFGQFDPRSSNNETLYPGALIERAELAPAFKPADTAPSAMMLFGTERRETICLPMSEGANFFSATFDFADEDWVDKITYYGEISNESVINPDGSLKAIPDSVNETDTIKILAMRGPRTTGWRKSVETNLASPVISPDQGYEVGLTLENGPYLCKKDDAGKHARIPLPVNDLARVEWSTDGRQVIFISSSGREQRLQWPPPQQWEPGLLEWLPAFGPSRDDRKAALTEGNFDDPSDAPANPNASPPPAFEDTKWLAPLKNLKLTDPAWQELQKWWLEGRPGPVPTPAPAVPANNDSFDFR